MSLLLALFEEHKQRTGHDFTKRDDQRVWCCTVCNALYAEKRREDEVESKAAESDTANADANLKYIRSDAMLAELAKEGGK